MSLKAEVRMQKSEVGLRSLAHTSAFCILTSAFLLVLASNAHAASLPALKSVALGFEGQYKLGCWTPLTIKMRGGATDLRGVVSVVAAEADGTLVRYHSELVDVPVGLDVDASLYIKLGRPSLELIVDFEHEHALADEPRTIGAASIAPPLEPDMALFVNVGPPPASPKVLVASRAVLVNTEQVDDLPDRWIGYEALDGLMLSTSRSELVGKLVHDAGQFMAVEDWVAHGGFVVVVASPHGMELLEGESPLARLLPGVVTTTVPLPRTDALESYGGTNERIALPSAADGGPWMVPQLENTRGVVELNEGNLPLIVRAARGLGETVYVATALDEPPLSTWNGRDTLVTRVLHQPSPTIDANLPGAARANLYGISDLSGQLFDALDQFDHVGAVSFWIVAALAIAYVALIGPIDFLLLQRVLRHLEWTWLTLPVASLASLVAIVAIGLFEKGTHDRANQVDLIDVDVARGRLRGTTWLSLFAAEPRKVDLALRRDVGQIIDDASDVAVGWYAPSGDAWGGMHSNATGPQVFDRPYDIPTSLDRMLSVPIEPWGVKMFCGRWISRIGPTIDANLRTDFEESLGGHLENRLKITLSNCLLLFGRYAYSLGNFEPGARREIVSVDRRELNLALKQFTVVKSEKSNTYLEAPLPYDPAGVDIPSILRTMMFYEALGGRSYAGVPAVEQSFVDLSHLLRLKRAVLLAEINTAESLGIQWRDQQGTIRPDPGRRWRFCRFVFHIDEPEEPGR